MQKVCCRPTGTAQAPERPPGLPRRALSRHPASRVSRRTLSDDSASSSNVPPHAQSNPAIPTVIRTRVSRSELPSHPIDQALPPWPGTRALIWPGARPVGGQPRKLELSPAHADNGA
eukprot:6691169-Prymnesium_polylepis.1